MRESPTTVRANPLPIDRVLADQPRSKSQTFFPLLERRLLALSGHAYASLPVRFRGNSGHWPDTPKRLPPIPSEEASKLVAAVFPFRKLSPGSEFDRRAMVGSLKINICFGFGADPAPGGSADCSSDRYGGGLLMKILIWLPRCAVIHSLLICRKIAVLGARYLDDDARACQLLTFRKRFQEGNHLGSSIGRI